MIKKILFSLACTLLLNITLFAQSNPRYLILYKDKTGSPFSTDKPTDFLSQRSVARRAKQNIPVTVNDLPVNPAYVTAIKQTGASVIYSSRWFNGSLVEASATQLEQIKKLSFYKGIELNLPVANLTSPSSGVVRTEAVRNKFETAEDLDYGRMRDQLVLMGVDILHQRGMHGENMIIAVLDNGFSQGNNLAFLKPLFDEKRIIDTQDFIGREGNVYNDGSHGLNVLSTMAAYLPSTMIGAAFKATYALYRTESDAIESPYEEITWLIAAERADSLGADIINSSLGYNTFDGEFNTPAYNYTYEDMDGKTTIISRAARFASRKGMVVTNSAGNEGSNSWRYIVAPADVDSVLSVGATNYDRSYSPLSSTGPNAAGQQKPDVAAVGAGAVVGNVSGTVSTASGTSFSSPLMAGFCAVLWQAYPNLSAQQLISVVKKSGHLAAAPDNRLGYGVPSVTAADRIVAAEYGPLGTEKEFLSEIILSPNPTEKDLILTIPETLLGKLASVRITGANGNTLSGYVVRLEKQTSVNTTLLSTGLYVLNLKIGTLERSLKFIKR
ncbi:S8 family peptidase [Dyadobacter psychrotolerans]|uniref:T9SS type A sorting domain-containing protein n=1 Tax=Dyadobacter psychrotolerans TaxID=2541721 RepID=A0A4R5DVB8_9BACT|nr:S8 family peptidase [Dyadobacter psychrotolerans]TDE16300.1 T9SS type A sorting domain-containing protein [Dyadobacter psychrotolerans]